MRFALILFPLLIAACVRQEPAPAPSPTRIPLGSTTEVHLTELCKPESMLEPAESVINLWSELSAKRKATKAGPPAPGTAEGLKAFLEAEASRDGCNFPRVEVEPVPGYLGYFAVLYDSQSHWWGESGVCRF